MPLGHRRLLSKTNKRNDPTLLNGSTSYTVQSLTSDLSPVRAQPSESVPKTNCSKATSSWSCSWESLTAAGSSMRSIWSSVQKTAPPGSSFPSWRPSWETQTGPEPYLNWPLDNRDSTCQRFRTSHFSLFTVIGSFQVFSSIFSLYHTNWAIKAWCIKYDSQQKAIFLKVL